VRALEQEPQQAGLTNDEVLRLATADNRILVTHDVNTFPALLREFAEQGEDHAGAIIVAAIRSRDFDLITRAVETRLERYPQQEQWRNLTVFAAPANLTENI
jgi:Domain of unknown function (DUF5615)